jgi:glutaredoxin
MSSVRLAALAASVACACLWAASASAQVYRIVGPDGRVTFSDRPPADAKAAPAQTVTMPGSSGTPSTAGMPLELRAAVTRYPLTLYTSRDCGPCNSARSFLSQRGIPFAEKTISTEADVNALTQLTGAARLPFATLGAQHLRGFSQSEWSQYLDAAGYPKVSALPPTYRNPAPGPMVALEAPRPAEAGPAQAEAGTPSAPSAPAPSNPAGIRF